MAKHSGLPHWAWRDFAYTAENPATCAHCWHLGPMPAWGPSCEWRYRGGTWRRVLEMTMMEDASREKMCCKCGGRRG